MFSCEDYAPVLFTDLVVFLLFYVLESGWKDEIYVL